MPLFVNLFLLVLGLVLFILAGLGVRPGRYDLVAFGLAAWILTAIIATFPK